MQDRQQTRYRVSDLVSNALLQLAGLLCVSGVLFCCATKVVNSCRFIFTHFDGGLLASETSCCNVHTWILVLELLAPVPVKV